MGKTGRLCFVFPTDGALDAEIESPAATVSLFRQGKGFINHSTTSTWVSYSENPPQLLLYTSHPWISKQVRTGDKLHFRDREAKSKVAT